MKTIYIVDDSVSNLRIAKETLSTEFTTVLLTSGEQLFRALEQNHPDMILLDIEMPVMNGFEVMEKLQADPRHQGIPVIFLTALGTAHVEARALSMGIVDFISKPFSPELLLLRVKLHMEMSGFRKNLQELVHEKTNILERLHGVVSLNIADLIGARDGYSGVHVKRTCSYLEVFIQQMLDDKVNEDKLTEEFVRTVLRAAPLHDIGKIGIVDDVLCKPGKLTPEEFEQMKRHTELGGEALQKTQDTVGEDFFLSIAYNMALFHHEKWDGSGYMQGIAQENIPLCARIMAIVDVYDALTSRRQYKEPFTHMKSVEIITSESGKHFDPALVEVFMRCHKKLEQRLMLLRDDDIAV